MIRFGNIPTCQQNERWEREEEKNNQQREREREKVNKNRHGE
jgi:hypothetical protein